MSYRKRRAVTQGEATQGAMPEGPAVPWSAADIEEMKQDFPLLGIVAAHVELLHGRTDDLQREMRPWNRPTRKLVAIVLAVVVGAGASAWLAYPWTKAQCYERAAQARTINGTQIMYRLCEQEFGRL